MANTSTDWRALCAELADALEEWQLGGAPPEDTADADLIARARAAIAQPELVAGGEAATLASELRHFISEYQKMRGLDPENIYSIHQGDPIKEAHLRISRLTRSADLLEHLAQPEPVGLTDEEILNLSQEHQVSYTMCDGGVIYPLQAGADMKDDVLSFARALIAADRARWGRPAVEPVPVSERLPGPTDDELNSFLVDVACQNGNMYYADPMILARAVLARWGRPAIKPVPRP